MKYQYKREPLTQDEINQLTNACQSHEEKLVVWTLLDTGLRVAEFANLKKDNIDWQGKRLMIYGKDGIYGTSSKRRIVPLSNRVFTLIEKHFALYDAIGLTPRTIQRMMKPIANRAAIARPVTPHVLRHSFACAAVQKGISLAAAEALRTRPFKHHRDLFEPLARRSDKRISGKMVIEKSKKTDGNRKEKHSNSITL